MSLSGSKLISACTLYLGSIYLTKISLEQLNIIKPEKIEVSIFHKNIMFSMNLLCLTCGCILSYKSGYLLFFHAVNK